MTSSTPLPDRESLLAGALEASLLAGRAILEVYDSDFEVRFKDDRSPLTEADRRSHEILVRHLAGTAPIPILSEEGRGIPYEERKSWDRFWLIDPLDGTKEFIKRSHEFTVNVALMSENRPVLGIVFLPATGELFFAAEGRGSFWVQDYRNIGKEGIAAAGADELVRHVLSRARPLQPPPPTQKISGLKIVYSLSHSSVREDEFIAGIKSHFGKVETLSAGSSLKFCRVAHGRADVYPRFGPTMEWDTAAGQCVVEQAGGEVLEIGLRAALRYNKPELLNPSFVVLGPRLKALPAQRDAVLNALRP